MKTTIIHQIYQIEDIDKSGLIPEGAKSVMIYYDEKGTLRDIHFSPKIQFQGVNYNEEILKRVKKLNPFRTQEEKEKILSHLESSLTNSQ